MAGFSEMRTFLRKKTQLSVQVFSIVDAKQKPRELQGARFVASDVGAGGVGIETLVLLEKGDVMEFCFPLPGGKVIRAHGIVRNVRYEQRVGRQITLAGVEFLKIADLDRKAVADFVGSGDFMV